MPGPITAHPSLSYPETRAGLELRSFHRVRFSRRWPFLPRISRELGGRGYLSATQPVFLDFGNFINTSASWMGEQRKVDEREDGG